MFGNLMDKLQGAQADMNQRLANILVDGQADNGNVKVVVSGLKEVKQVFISDELFAAGDKEAIEDLVLVAINKAMEKAEEINSAEMKSIAGNMMPGMAGLFGK